MIKNIFVVEKVLELKCRTILCMSGEEFSDWYMYIYSVSCLVELTLAVKYIYFLYLRSI